MVIKRWWVGIGIGFGVTVGLLYWLRMLASGFVVTAQNFDSAGHFVAVLWLIAVGIAVYLICAASQRNALIAATPGFLLLATYAPLVFGQAIPEWYPDWLSELALFSYNMHTPVIIGVLAGAAVWNGWQRVRSRTDLLPELEPSLQTVNG
jgi:hypothetical protein